MQLLLAFREKLRAYHIGISALLPWREFDLAARQVCYASHGRCFASYPKTQNPNPTLTPTPNPNPNPNPNQVCYASHGHYFAVAVDRSVLLFDAYSHAQLGTQRLLNLRLTLTLPLPLPRCSMTPASTQSPLTTSPSR